MRSLSAPTDLPVPPAAASMPRPPGPGEGLQEGSVAAVPGSLRRQVADLDEAKVLEEVPETHVELAVICKHQVQATADVLRNVCPLGVTAMIFLPLKV